MFFDDKPFQDLNTSDLFRSFLDTMIGVIQLLPGEMKCQLIVRKINLPLLLTATNIESLNEIIKSGKIYNCPSTQYTNTTNILALAICAANIEACELFLQDFSDLKNSSYFVRGYRQAYSWLHLALDPHGHIGHESSRENLLNIEARLKLISLLAEKGADPNWKGDDDNYQNPPLTAGHPSGRTYDEETTFQLRKRLIECGADPHLQGSSFSLSEDEMSLYSSNLKS